MSPGSDRMEGTGLAEVNLPSVDLPPELDLSDCISFSRFSIIHFLYL